MNGQANGEAGEAPGAVMPDLPLESIRELFVTLAKALRAHRLYDENNPVYQRFVSALRTALERVWQDTDLLQVHVDERRLVYMGEEVYRSDDRTDSIAFMFWKDGIREVIFQKGLEGAELELFLGLLQRSRTLQADGEDLLTVLWEADLQFFRYGYVDLLAEGLALPEANDTSDVDLSHILEAEVGAFQIGEPDDEESPASDVTPTVRPDDFNPTLYSLGPAEMEYLRREIDGEMNRDLRGEVLACLFDRLEEPKRPDRQLEIVGVLRQLLPNFLSKGALGSVGQILQELTWLAGQSNLANDAVRGRIAETIQEMSADTTLAQLVASIRDGSIAPDPEALTHVLQFLNSSALPHLLKLARQSGGTLRPLLREGVHGIASRHPKMVGKLLSSEDPILVSESVLLIGRLGMTKGIPAVGKLMSHSDGRVRLACLEVMVRLKAASLYANLERLLADPERQVRIAAARAVAMLTYKPAAIWLRTIVESKHIRQADLSERIAVFQAFGTLGDAGSVELLSGLLNGRGLFRRKEDDETRACAAMALGEIGSSGAREALLEAKEVASPIVRNAVRKALRPRTDKQGRSS